MKPEYISLADAVGLTEKSESYLTRFAVDRRIDLFVLVVNRWGIELKVVNENNDLAFPVTGEPVLLDGEFRLHEKTVKSFWAYPDDAYFGVPGHQTFESHEGKLFMLADTDAFWRSAIPVKLTSQNLCFRADDLAALITDQKASTDTTPTAKEWQAAPKPNDNTTSIQTEQDAPDTGTDCLDAHFDPVGIPQLEAMFPSGGNWRKWADRPRSGLVVAARERRGYYNPYRAARWWLDTKHPPDMKWEKCLRTLANNLPDRSLHLKGLLTGDFD